jgi:hypothetical protein
LRKVPLRKIIVAAMTTADNPKAYSRKCSVDICKLSLSAYRLDSDGRKWKKQAENRQRFLIWLSNFADPDGSNIWPSIETMMKKMGASKETIHTWLDELRFCLSKQGYSKSGTRMRKLNVAALELNEYIRERYTDNPKHQAFMAALREEGKKIGPLTLAEKPGVFEFTLVVDKRKSTE